jgi:hypothetical protein
MGFLSWTPLAFSVRVSPTFSPCAFAKALSSQTPSREASNGFPSSVYGLASVFSSRAFNVKENVKEVEKKKQTMKFTNP